MRLFFAFWPDDATRQAIAGRLPELLGDYPCKPQRPDQWHLTVEFLGEVPQERWPALHEAAAAAVSSAVSGLREPATASAVSGFREPDTREPDTVRKGTVRLDRLEHWLKPQVLCLVATQVPAGVTALAGSLKSALQERGFTPESRPFKAHLTLARKARQHLPSRPVQAIEWPVRELVLVQSITDPSGSRYEPLACWNAGHDGPPRID
jgi:2'-5' RNA ligase